MADPIFFMGVLVTLIEIKNLTSNLLVCITIRFSGHKHGNHL